MGQCGNQLGQEFWAAVASAGSSKGSGKAGGGAGRKDGGSSIADVVLQEEGEFLRLNAQGQRQGRGVMVDTEPKVSGGAQGKKGRECSRLCRSADHPAPA